MDLLIRVWFCSREVTVLPTWFIHIAIMLLRRIKPLVKAAHEFVLRPIYPLDSFPNY